MDENYATKVAPTGTSTLQLAGIIALATGFVSAIIVTVTAILWRLKTGEPMPYEIVLVLLGASGGAVGFGLLERINRPTRTAVLGMAARVEETARSVELLSTRMDRLEQAISHLPAYGQGVIDGMQMRQNASLPYRD